MGTLLSYVLKRWTHFHAVAIRSRKRIENEGCRSPDVQKNGDRLSSNSARKNPGLCDDHAKVVGFGLPRVGGRLGGGDCALGCRFVARLLVAEPARSCRRGRTPVQKVAFPIPFVGNHVAARAERDRKIARRADRADEIAPRVDRIGEIALRADRCHEIAARGEVAAVKSRRALKRDREIT
ncbi:MAG: hypothetical protein E6K70_02135 [Planctomycetota bacterium]|nr:MAG: hypothetical protein E6K70_02135 [Planctomycetota bacterium]